MTTRRSTNDVPAPWVDQRKRSRARFAVLAMGLAMASCGGKASPHGTRGSCGASVVVQVSYPGASAAEVDNGIVTALRDAIRAIKGTGDVHASAHEGHATVIINSASSSPPDVLALRQRVNEAVNAITSFPTSSERPHVAIGSSGVVTAVALAGVAPHSPVSRSVLARIRRHPDVLSATLVGGDQRVSVVADPARLMAYGVGTGRVIQALRRRDLQAPTSRGIRIRGHGRRTVPDLGKVVLPHTAANVPIHLSSVASIRREAHGVTILMGTDPGSVFLVRTATPAVAAALHPKLAALVDASAPANARIAVGPPMQGAACSVDARPLSKLMARVTIRGRDLEKARALLHATAETSPTFVLTGGELMEPGQATSLATPEIMQAVYFAKTAEAATRRVQRWRKALAALPNLRLTVNEPALHTTSVVLDHGSWSVPNAVATTLQSSITADNPRLSVTRYPSMGTQQMTLKMRQEVGARRHGVAAYQVANVVRAATVGKPIGRIQEGAEAVSVVLFVRPTRDPPRTAADVENLLVRVAGGFTVPVRDLAHVSMASDHDAGGAIYRYNGRPRSVLRITAESSAALATIKKKLRKIHLPTVRKQTPALKVTMGR